MWSDKYYYLNIFHDAGLQEYADTGELVAFLKTLPELHQTGEYTFSNHRTYPTFIGLSLLYARHLNNWSEKETNAERTNLIAVVCGKSDDERFEQAKSLLVRIASFLRWQLVDEETDDGVENFIIWAPGRGQ